MMKQRREGKLTAALHAKRGLPSLSFFASFFPLAFLVLFFCWPLFAILSRGFLSDGFTLGFAAETFSQPRTWKILWQTVSMALAGTFFSLLFGIPAAWVLYTRRCFGIAFFRGLSVIPFVLPSVVVGVAFRAVLGREGWYSFLGWDGTTNAVVAAMVFFNISVVVRTVGTLWASLDPGTGAAARSLGASPIRAFATVTLPALAPAIASAASLVFLFCSTAFGIVQTLGSPGYGTLETEIFVQTTTFLNLPVASILSLLQFCIVILALGISRLISSKRRESARIGKGVRQPCAASSLPLIFLVYTVLTLTLLVPLLALTRRAFTKDGDVTFRNFQLLLEPGEGFTGGTSVAEALLHSLKIAGDATLISLCVGLALAFILARKTRGLEMGMRSLLSFLSTAPLGISAVTLGFGYFLALQSPPTDFSDTHLLVPLAQAVVALPLVVRSLLPTLRAVDPQLRSAARLLGASPLRVLATIDLPFLARGIGAATGFAFAISLGEFGATSFLASPDYLTLPVIISRLLSRPGADNYGMAMAGALLLALLTSAIMLLSEALAASVSSGGSRS